MYPIQTTKLFEKDIKKAKKRGKDLQKLRFVINELAKGKPLPLKYKDHRLVGNYIGFKECHIEPDWLLIYKIEEHVLYLARTGTHSDFF
jgi:mRNA interferase YafQ